MKNKFGFGFGVLGGSGSKAWNPQSIMSRLLFWGMSSEETGGHQPNKVTGATDYLTVSGTPKIYSCPNTTPYKNADTDKVWVYSDGTTLRSVLTADLNGFDFSRTWIKYGNTSPYAIEEIIIPLAGATFTTAEMNHIRDYMKLSAWWDNTLSFHGDSKGNRTHSQSVWTPVSGFEAETVALLAAMTVQPPDARKTVINKYYKSAKARTYWAKRIRITLAAHNEQAYCLNVANPGTFDLVPGGSPAPVYEVDRGGSGNGSTAHYDTQFIPATHGGTIYTVGKASHFVYLRLNKDEAGVISGCYKAGDAGANAIYPRTANMLYSRFNSMTDVGLANTDSRRFLGHVRSVAFGNPKIFLNKIGTIIARDFTGLSTVSQWILSGNNNGSIWGATTNQLAFEWDGGELTDQEVSDLQDDALAYLTAIGANV